MSIKEYVLGVIHAFLPGKYRMLSAQSTKHILRSVFLSLCFTLLLSIIVAIPALIALPQAIDQKISSFDHFEISLNVSAPQAIVLTDSPLILVDLQNRTRSDGVVVFTQDDIVFKKYVWFGQERLSWASLDDVKANSSQYTAWLLVLALFLLPLLFCIIIVFSLFESIVLVFFFFAVFFLFTRAAKFYVSRSQLVKILLLALIPFFFVQFVAFAYVRWFIVPTILYVLVSTGAVWFLGEKKRPQSKKQKE